MRHQVGSRVGVGAASIAACWLIGACRDGSAREPSDSPAVALSRADADSLGEGIAPGEDAGARESATPPRRRPRMTSARPRSEESLDRAAAVAVRVGPRWMTYDEVVADAGRDKRLAEYRDRRREAEATVAGQVSLADWCRRQQLTEQERVHLLAVIALDPGHAIARSRLGHRRVGERWIDPRGVAAAREAEARLTAAFGKQAAALRVLAARLGTGAILPEEAAAGIEERCDPAGIVLLETCLSTANEPAAASVVEALSRHSGEAVSESLVRHAVSSRWPGVRQAAIDVLRERDRRGWVPLLLDAFAGVVSSQVAWREEIDGSFSGRFVQVAEGADRIRVAVHEHGVQAPIDPERCPSEALLMAALLTIQADERRGAINRQLAVTNASVAAVLRAATGESIGDDPAAWRAWWSEQTGTPIPARKPLESYSSRGWSRSQISMVVNAAMTQPRLVDCLAAGTVVWTQSGPVAIDQLQPGDLVLSQDPDGGTLALRPVLATTVRPAERPVTIGVAGGTIRASAQHPFRVVGRGWTMARDLMPGNRLTGLDGAVVVESIGEEETPVRSFNVVVADDHTYFCGPAKVLCHDVTKQRSALGLGE